MEEGMTQTGLRMQILDVLGPHKKTDIRTYSPLALAFLGDAVFSLVIRTMIVAEGNRQAQKLHQATSYYVCAGAQARIGDAIADLLTDEERTIYRRGRNANPAHQAKNATTEDYLKATALETLCGYLYLQHETDRMLELIREGIERSGLKK